MAEANQYVISLEDMVRLIIKETDVHEGLWTTAVTLMIGTGTFPNPTKLDQSLPGASVMVSQLGIQRVIPGAPIVPGSVVVDAAKINAKKRK